MLTAETVRHQLHYDPNTGEFRWVNCYYKTKNGQLAGCVNSAGYRVISIGGKLHLAHRLAWLYMTGDWPEFEIDHRDLNSENNIWENLRAATHQQNLSNLGMRKSNTSGRKGVYFSSDRQKWCARIRFGAKKIHLGYFDDLEKAHHAYNEASRKYHGEFGRIASK